MPNLNRTKNINFNCLLDEETDGMLIRLAAEKKRPKAFIVREAIQNWAKMSHRRTPTCADGQDCRCPHAHIYAPSNPIADPSP